MRVCIRKDGCHVNANKLDKTPAFQPKLSNRRKTLLDNENMQTFLEASAFSQSAPLIILDVRGMLSDCRLQAIII
jgi:hypothetical protein